MFHIVISDTHSFQCTDWALEYAEKIVHDMPLVDTIVINGDILTSTSMPGSVLHKNKAFDKDEYLKSGAPNFYEKYVKDRRLNRALAISYIRERYEQMYSLIKRSCGIVRTIFNLGNHESEHQALVLRELSMLTGQQIDVGAATIKRVVKEFEEKLYHLEKEMDFYYVRNKHVVLDGTMIFGIPGISHETTGMEKTARMQEDHTSFLAKKAQKDVSQVDKIIFYNHTQGDYNQQTGLFRCASPSLRNFMGDLPDVQKIFVQSHNHWSYTQHMKHGGVHYIMNNAGLHAGIFNLIEFSDGVHVYDADPVHKKITKVKMNTDFSPVATDEERIGRFYDDVSHILSRKMQDTVSVAKKRVFG